MEPSFREVVNEYLQISLKPDAYERFWVSENMKIFFKRQRKFIVARERIVAAEFEQSYKANLDISSPK